MRIVFSLALIVCLIYFALAVAVAVLPDKLESVDRQQYVSQVSSTTFSRPMPCQEDEVYVWVDAPSLARCVNWDDVPSLIERMKR